MLKGTRTAIVVVFSTTGLWAWASPAQMISNRAARTANAPIEAELTANPEAVEALRQQNQYVPNRGQGELKQLAQGEAEAPQPDPNAVIEANVEPAPDPNAEAPPPPPEPSGIQPVIPVRPAQPGPPNRGIRVPSSVPGGPAGAPPPAPGGEVKITEGADTVSLGNTTTEPLRNDGEPQDKPLYLDFNNAQLSDVIESIGRMLGKNFDIDPTVGQQPVTIISHQRIPAELLLNVLESILTTRGAQLVEKADGYLIQVRPVGEDAEHHKFIHESTSLPDGDDGNYWHIVQVQHQRAEELATIISKLGSKFATADVYGKTNTLILHDNADGIRNMLMFLEKVDLPGYNEVLEYVPLEFARAEVVATQLQEILVSASGEAAPAPTVPGQPVRPQIVRPTTAGGRNIANIPQQKNQTIVSGDPLSMQIVPDERLNALIIKASEPLVEEIYRLIEKLDQPTPPDANNMHVVHLQYARAEDVEAALGALLGSSPRPTGGGGGGGGGGAGGGGAGGGGGGAVSSGEVQIFEKNVTITQFESTNSLIIIASPQDYAVIQQVISNIDMPKRQVHVEAVILEVGINDRYRLSVEAAELTANDYFALNNIVSLANVLNDGPLAATEGTDSPVFAGGIIDGTTEISIPDGAGGFITEEVPNVPFLMTALENLTALDVLSRPSVLIVDNEEANIVVGQQVPFISGNQRSLGDSGGTNAFVFNTIQREDVGIKMKVTPQISEGDYVLMELEVEVSSTVPSDVGLDPNLVGPTVQLSQVTNQLVIKDGATGIVGGLISETTDRSRRQTPVLGDVPVLGWLFKRKDDVRRKRNLVVLVTPHILKEYIDTERRTEIQLEEMREANMDVFFEKGIIKKVQKKHDMRKNFRPTMTEIDSIQKERFTGANQPQ
ncbi:MAG: type II secretion system protein GspD [Candidatus Hydrogenedentota bacterium]